MFGPSSSMFMFFAWLLLTLFWIEVQSLGSECTVPISYSREALLQLRDDVFDQPRLALNLSPVMKTFKKRKRGCRSGVRIRNRRRQFKPVFPSVIMGNVRSLSSKVDFLSANLKYDRLFRQSSLLCFTETWLTDSTPSSSMDMDGFSFHRLDRDLVKTRKKTGGGLCLYVNDQWCLPAHVTVKQTVNNPDIELLAVSCRPYYLPRETSHVFVMVVYIPPDGNAKSASETISRVTHNLQRNSPDALVIIKGESRTKTYPPLNQTFIIPHLTFYR